MSKIVVGMGEALWDILPEGKKIGGAPANFAYHVSQFGIDSCAVSAIGDDALGDELLENFNKKEIKYMIEKVPYPTGTVQVEIDQAGIPQYEIKENVAWDNIPWTEQLAELARNTKAVCFGSLAQRNVVSRETISRFLDEMPKNDDIQPQDAHTHLRHQRQLRLHPRQRFVPAHTQSGGGRHCRRRRLFHGSLHSQHPQRTHR